MVYHSVWSTRSFADLSIETEILIVQTRFLDAAVVFREVAFSQKVAVSAT